MYQTSEEVSAAILSYSRTWRIRLEEVGGDTIIDGNEISQASSEHTSTSQPEDIELGAVCAQHWTVLTSRSGDYVGKQFLLYLYLIDLDGVNTTWGDIENYTVAELSHWRISELQEIIGSPIPVGTFTCVKAPRSGEGRELHLYDKLYFADKPYEPGISLPAMATAVERDICRQLGIDCAAEYTAQGYLYTNDGGNGRLVLTSSGHPLYTADYEFTIPSVGEGTTMRQMLGYIAAANGHFGCIDRQGRYVRRWYGDPVMTIDRDHADEPTLSESANRIVGLKCRVGDTELTTGAQSGGRVLEFDNPYMTPGLLAALFVRIRSMQWYTTRIYERLGDPRHDIGDVVTVETEEGDYDMPITNLSLTFDGGLSADIEAVGLTDEEQI